MLLLSVVRGSRKGQLIWHVERVQPGEHVKLELFIKDGLVRSLTATATIGSACEEFDVVCRDRADNTLLIAQFTN